MKKSILLISILIGITILAGCIHANNAVVQDKLANNVSQFESTQELKKFSSMQRD